MTRFTVEITFNSAHNLPVADINTLSSDPYIHATLLLPEHKEQDHKHSRRGEEGDGKGEHPPLSFRTPTVRRSRDPVWTKHPPSSEDAVSNEEENPSVDPRRSKQRSEAANDSDRNSQLPSLCQWVVGGVPSSGFELVLRLRDEDPGNKDDRLGKTSLHFPSHGEKITEGLEVNEGKFDVKKRKGSPLVYLQTYLAAIGPKRKVNKHAFVVLSIKVLGPDPSGVNKIYTVGPNKWSQHFSPLLGAIAPARHAAPGADKKEKSSNDKSTQGPMDAPPDPETLNPTPSSSASSSQSSLANLTSSTFVASKLQLTGPVPDALRHPFVGYAAFVQKMFTDAGLRGRALNIAMRKQYHTIYSHDKSTRYGVVGVGRGGDGVAGEHKQEAEREEAQGDDGHKAEEERHHSKAFAKQFLKMTSFGSGGRLYTYVITLDGEWRFTETGEEFSVDLLSKHTMHADVARVIAFSGEFFVRRCVDKEGGGFESGVKVERGTIKKEAEEEKKKEEEKKNNKQEGKGGGDGAAKNEDNNSQDSDQDKKEEKSEKKDDENPQEEAGDNTGAGLSEDISSDTSSIPEDPSLYELVIDNDSGTYRPLKSLLPELREWLSAPERLGALGRITAVDGFDEGLKKIKEERAELRKKGKGINGDEGGATRGGMLRRGSSASDVGRKWNSPLNLVKMMPKPTSGKDKN